MLRATSPGIPGTSGKHKGQHTIHPHVSLRAVLLIARCQPAAYIGCDIYLIFQLMAGRHGLGLLASALARRAQLASLCRLPHGLQVAADASIASRCLHGSLKILGKRRS